jgi:hypothetical protein
MAATCTILAIVLTIYPGIGPLVFGAAFAVGMFIPGWKYSRGT